MNRFFYSTLFYLATPALLGSLWWRSRRAPDYRQRWRERFALYDNPAVEQPVDIMFHAVSVGEVHATVPLIRQLQAQHPALKILVTTTTPTGSARVTALLADSVQHVYLPYDMPGPINRFLDRFAPRLVVIMETEWWPNLIHSCQRRNIRLLLANARLSEKSQKNYGAIKGLARTMLEQFDAITAQSDEDSHRLQALGASPNKIEVAGSMKYDMPLHRDQLAQARTDKQGLAGRPVMIAASTRVLDGDSEDEKVLAAFRQVLAANPQTLLILVPRHPERFDSVAALAGKAGFRVARRSRDSLPLADDHVFIGDSMGEMHYYLGLSDLAFVGGSLVNTGCQNIIEPAAMGLPVITGPSRFNFQAVSDGLVAAGGQQIVADADELATTVNALLADPARRHAMGDAAVRAVQVNQGATARNLGIINRLLEAPPVADASAG